MLQSPLFQKQKKKPYKKQIQVLDEEIQKIIKNPEIGQEKKGDLQGIRVHKFHIEKQLFLLAYELETGTLKLIMIGGHENYYRSLAKHHSE
ncbi:MAG: type II toxin-antitoxin system RelE/ParE family toxin [Actinomycetota bacterium]|nr:type II toxin-antitoxin system RelE/ParE family toxin [Actinomycetota bacterium]